MAYAMWILPVFQLALWLGFCSAADFTKSECFDTKEPNQQGSITISCPEDHVISVDGAVFGSNKWGACIITEDDCTEQTKIFAVCDGLVNCTRNFKTFTRTCGYSTMLVLGYSCIKTIKDHATTRPTNDPDNPSEWQPPDFSKPQVYPTRSIPKRPETPKPKSNKDGEELGLIIGCALASFITVVFLIIAIVMVIRRLIQHDEKDRRHHNSSTSSGGCDSICIKIDCLPCCSRSDSPRENLNDVRMRKNTMIESTNQTRQLKLKPRMAPIGQDSVNAQGSALPEDDDSTSNDSSEFALDTQPRASSASHGKLNSEKLAYQKREPSHQKSPNTSGLQLRGKRTKMKETNSKPVASASEDYDNENTLPSSYNRNLSPSEDEVSSSTEEHAESGTNNFLNANKSQAKRTHVFDAVAIPNTLTGSTC